MKKVKFKNVKHRLNYLLQLNLIPDELRSSTEIQAVIYVIALIESESPGAATYIFEYAKRLFGYGAFDSSNTEFDAISVALHLWKSTYIAFKEDFLNYFLKATSLGFLTILDCDLLDFYVHLLDHVKNIDKSVSLFYQTFFHN